MKEGKYMIKKIILVILSVGIGSYITTVLEQIEMNVWIARTCGALTTVVIALLLYKFYLNNSISRTNR